MSFAVQRGTTSAAPRLGQFQACGAASQRPTQHHTGGVFVLLSLNPKVAPSVFVNNLKTITSRYLRKEFSAHLKDYYWGNPVFWSRSYCIISCGGAPLSALRQYIEQQDAPE